MFRYLIAAMTTDGCVRASECQEDTHRSREARRAAGIRLAKFFPVAALVLASGCTTATVEPYRIPEFRWNPPPKVEPIASSINQPLDKSLRFTEDTFLYTRAGVATKMYPANRTEEDDNSI